MAKLGCGPLVAFVLVLLILLVLGSNEAVGYYYSHCQTEELFDCLMGALEEEEEPEEGSVVATGVYEYKGYAVNVTANIPLKGGNVTGQCPALARARSRPRTTARTMVSSAENCWAPAIRSS